MRSRYLALVAACALGCVEVSTDRTVYEVGDTIEMVVQNNTPLDAALLIGDSCRQLMQVRAPGEWRSPRGVGSVAGCRNVPQEAGGAYALDERATLVAPGASVNVPFSTRAISPHPDPSFDSAPAILRVGSTVFSACSRSDLNGSEQTIRCRRRDLIFSEPVVVFQPGTSETNTQ